MEGANGRERGRRKRDLLQFAHSFVRASDCATTRGLRPTPPQKKEKKKEADVLKVRLMPPAAEPKSILLDDRREGRKEGEREGEREKEREREGEGERSPNLPCQLSLSFLFSPRQSKTRPRRLCECRICCWDYKTISS